MDLIYGIGNVNEQNVLRLIIDKSLKFDSHVNYICKKLSKLFHLLRNCLMKFLMKEKTIFWIKI